MGTEINGGEAERTPEKKTSRAFSTWARLQSDSQPRPSTFGVGVKGTQHINDRRNKMAGIENLKKVLSFGCELINVGSKMVNGAGLWQLTSLIDDVAAIKNLKKEDLLAEVKDLSAEERAELLTLAKSSIKMTKEEIDKKVDQGLDLVNEAIDVGAEGLKVFAEVKSIVARVEALVKA